MYIFYDVDFRFMFGNGEKKNVCGGGNIFFYHVDFRYIFANGEIKKSVCVLSCSLSLCIYRQK